MDFDGSSSHRKDRVNSNESAKYNLPTKEGPEGKERPLDADGTVPREFLKLIAKIANRLKAHAHIKESKPRRDQCEP